MVRNDELSSECSPPTAYSSHLARTNPPGGGFRGLAAAEVLAIGSVVSESHTMDPTNHEDIEKLSRTELSAPARLAVRKELQRLGSLVPADENVHCIARGAYKGRFGLIAVTDKRLIFVDRARVHSQTASFSLKRVLKVERGVTLMGYGRLVVHLTTEDIDPVTSRGRPPTALRFKVLPKDHTAHLADAITRTVGIQRATVLEEIYDDRASIEVQRDTLEQAEVPEDELHRSDHDPE